MFAQLGSIFGSAMFMWAIYIQYSPYLENSPEEPSVSPTHTSRSPSTSSPASALPEARLKPPSGELIVPGLHHWKGRIDMHIEMSYCKFEEFKVLARNYLGVEGGEGLLEEVKMTPADVAEYLTPKKAEAADFVEACGEENGDGKCLERMNPYREMR